MRRIVQESQTPDNEQETTKTSAPSFSPETVVLNSDEMTTLFRDWENLGKGDFSVDPNLAQHVRDYISFQRELEPLRTELAKRIYKPFVIARTIFGKNIRVQITNRINVRIKFFQSEDTISEAPYDVIPLNNFKALLLAAGVPYASYIPSDAKTSVDFFSYCMASNWKLEVNENVTKYTITLPETM